MSFVMKTFMLGCRFSFEAHTNNVREKATKCSLKTTEVILDNDGHVLLEWIIFQTSFNVFKIV